jgi:leader peptidase (prepilin peptidase)/N-methyltransferase
MSAIHGIATTAAAVTSAAIAVWLPQRALRLTAALDARIPPTGPHRCIIGGAGALGAAALVWRLPTAPAAAVTTLAAWLVFVQAGVALALTDLATRRLPTPIITTTAGVTSALLTAGSVTVRDPAPVLAALAGSALLGGCYLAAAWLTPTGIGMGDVRLAALTGGLAAATGWDTALLAAALPYLLALPFAIRQRRLAHRSRHHEPDPQTHLPFGPFLVTGALAAAVVTG